MFYIFACIFHVWLSSRELGSPICLTIQFLMVSVPGGIWETLVYTCERMGVEKANNSTCHLEKSFDLAYSVKRTPDSPGFSGPHVHGAGCILRRESSGCGGFADWRGTASLRGVKIRAGCSSLSLTFMLLLLESTYFLGGDITAREGICVNGHSGHSLGKDVFFCLSFKFWYIQRSLLSHFPSYPLKFGLYKESL